MAPHAGPWIAGGQLLLLLLVARFLYCGCASPGPADIVMVEEIVRLSGTDVQLNNVNATLITLSDSDSGGSKEHDSSESSDLDSVERMATSDDLIFAAHKSRKDSSPHSIDLLTSDEEDSLAAHEPPMVPVTPVTPINLDAFAALVPLGEVRAIACQYYRHDEEVQRAHAFLTSDHFAEMQRQLVQLPEVLALIRYLNASGLDVVKLLHRLTHALNPEQLLSNTNDRGIDKNDINAVSITTAKAVDDDDGGERSTRAQLNGLHGLVDSILDALPQDQMLATFFDKMETDTHFSHLIDSIGTPAFAKILSDMQINDSLMTPNLLLSQAQEEVLGCNFHDVQLAQTNKALKEQLRAHLIKDPLACDARWSIFVAAATSPRYENLLRPFPRHFLNSIGQPDIDRVCDAMADILRLCNDSENKRPDVVRLLHDVLVNVSADFSTLTEVHDGSLLAQLHMDRVGQQPTHIFLSTAAKSKFCNRFPVGWGFYGGPLEHFYGLLNDCRLPDNQPLRLSTDLNAALELSPPGAGWGGSRCGSVLRCVALVEYAKDPQCIDVESFGCYSQVVVKDFSCAHVSYILLYGQSCEEYLKPQLCQKILTWVEANRAAISLGLYLMMVSFNASRSFGPSVVPSGLGFFRNCLVPF